MTARVNCGGPRRISAEALRSETAAVIHPVYRGAVKMVAANRPPNGVSRSRIDRECEGHDANRLEMLCTDLDRIVIEKGRESLAPVLAFLVARYGIAEGGECDGVMDDLADIATAAGNLLARGIERAKDGVQQEELPELEQLAHRVRELCARFVREAQAAAGISGMPERATSPA